MNFKAINIINFSFKYNQKNILNNINIQINSGEKVGLIGANGAGKTSLFLCICGILPSTEGEIYLFDKLVKKGQFYPDIGLVFQNPDDQLFCPTVRDDIIFGAKNLGLSTEEIDNRLQEVLQATSIEHLVNRIPHELSGGEKCMVAIASVTIMKPKVVLYDEPSANLDLKARRRLIKFLQSCQQTIMVSAHDLELILEVCDRVVVLNQGKIVGDGKPEIIMRDMEFMEANCLEVPPSLVMKSSDKNSNEVFRHGDV